MEIINEKQDIQAPPPNYLAWAIITTILCCLPFGIVSIIYASQVNNKWVAGDFTGAASASKNAKIWAWVSFAAGVLAFIISMIIAAVTIGAAFWTNGFDF